VTGPQVGDVVCDCRYRHLRVIEVNGDDLVLEDGSHCSWEHCCDAVPHDAEHPAAVQTIEAAGAVPITDRYLDNHVSGCG
jgi:hypothetical protein